MHTQLLTFTPNASQLLVYFAGWGTPTSAVAHLSAPNDSDVLLCSNYHTLKLDIDCSTYTQISVIAWSMGVWVAERAMHNIPLHHAIAINGTGLPRHDELGIPTAIFDHTLASLSPINRQKFERRMCDNQEALAMYQRLDNHRDLNSLKNELSFLQQALKNDERTDLIQWSKAIIGEQDLIFPASQQKAYWQSRCDTKIIEKGAHYLFNQWQSWEDLCS